MIKLLGWFLIMGVPFGLIQAQQLEDALPMFDEANQLVESGAYQEAIDRYHSVIETGYISGALYHNLASTYFRIDEIGQTVRYYERARRLLGNDPQLIHNIQIVESRIQNPFSQLPKPFWREWWDQWFGQHHALPYLVTGISFYFMACFLFAQSLWSTTRSNWHRRARRIALTMGLALLLIAVLISNDRNTPQGASILMPTTMNTETERIDVPEGIKVTLVTESEEGTLIRLPNGIQGLVDPEILGDF